MKKLIYKVSASFCIALAATSCLNDLLDVESKKFDAANVYTDYTLAEYAVFNIGEATAEEQSYRGRLDGYYGTNTDIEISSTSSHSTSSWATAAKVQIPEYNVEPSNSELDSDKNGYIQIMNGLERANLCIDGLSTYADLNNPDMAYLLGEALTWRAFYYFDLIRMWGEVPLRNGALTSDNMYIAKSDRDAIYSLVLSDLERAIPLLYKPFETTQTSSAFRVNKALAAGLYARAALAACGWAWRPDDGQVGTGNAGSLRHSIDPEFSGSGVDELYHKALGYLQEAMTWGNSLESSYEDLWRKFNNSTHLNSKEVMWVRPYSNGRGRWNYTHAPKHESSPYIGGGSRGGNTGPMPTLWWKYEKEDVRRDMTCVPWTYVNDGFKLRGSVNYWFWGKYRYEWMFANPYTGGNDDGIKPIIMRYSDILLMAAELAAYEGDLDSAKKYLLEVRRRAYKGNEAKADAYVNALTLGSAAHNVDAAKSDYNTEGTIMKAIIDERALEFAGEMLRKGDLIRWGLLKIKLDEAAADVKALAEMTGDYEKYRNSARFKVKEDKDSKTGEIVKSYNQYTVYWRVKPNNNYPESGTSPVEIFGLEDDEISAAAPSDYTDIEPNGWANQGYLSTEAFFSAVNNEYRYENGFYRNSFNDPWPRSVWPISSIPVSTSYGSLVNDYGY